MAKPSNTEKARQYDWQEKTAERNGGEKHSRVLPGVAKP
jgi:hypothetical protein